MFQNSDFEYTVKTREYFHWLKKYMDLKDQERYRKDGWIFWYLHKFDCDVIR